MDPNLIPLIAGNAQGLMQNINNMANIGSGLLTNRAARKWQEKMYERQRQDSLSDWAMQNDYNSFENQMRRLKAAGLNPNLVYGKGTSQEAGAVRSSNVGSWRPDAPQFNFAAAGGSIAPYYDMQIKQATIDNLKAQNTVITQEALLKAATILGTHARTDKTRQDIASGKFDLDLKSDLRSTSLEMAKELLNKTKLDQKLNLNADERAASQNALTLREGAERILSSRQSRLESQARISKMGAEHAKVVQEIQSIVQQRKNLRQDETLKQLDIDLKRLGVQPGDELWQRIIARILNMEDITMPTGAK